MLRSLLFLDVMQHRLAAANLCCITSQKNKSLNYTEMETWNLNCSAGNWSIRWYWFLVLILLTAEDVWMKFPKCCVLCEVVHEEKIRRTLLFWVECIVSRTHLGNLGILYFRHLTKLYDSISKLEFEQSEGRNTKNAIAMWAKDGEFMKFNGVCDCSGKVKL